MGLNKLETFVSTITTNQQHLLHGEGKRPCKVAILIYVILVKTKLLEILSRAHCPCTAEDYLQRESRRLSGFKPWLGLNFLIYKWRSQHLSHRIFLRIK